MSETTDKPGGVSLLSTLLPSVIFLASNTLIPTDNDPGDVANKFLLSDHIFVDRDNTEMDPETYSFDDLKSSELIKMLPSARFKDWLGRDISNILTTSEQSSENETEKIADIHPSFLAYILLVGSLLCPSLLGNKRYEAIVDNDYHQSCHLQTSAMSNAFLDNLQTFEVTIVFEKNQIITVIFPRFDFHNERKRKKERKKLHDNVLQV